MLRTARRRRAKDGGVWYPRWFWPSFAAPGAVWLLVLFAVPFYVVLSVAFGTVDPIFRNPVPVWNPIQWYPGTFRDVLGQIFGTNAFLGPPFLRTFLYVAMASAICLLIAYPVAYYVARYAGRRRGMLLVLLIAPFWISYMMRMLAWVNLLGNDGLVNRSLTSLHLVGHPVAWLSGRPITVVLGLVYGYIPYMILPLFAGLDRIDTNLLEAARDLGANRARTFARVTLPLSKQAILAGMVIVALPMFGDYFTNDLLSGSPKTSMIGNLIDDSVGTPGQGTNAAVLVLILTVILIIPMLYYVSSTGRATRERSG
ncbi:MAG: ABC transporter permease [Actinobacteria bacterium]|nr:MAG: ABC transporter permease [Actinomycetota bacterium]